MVYYITIIMTFDYSVCELFLQYTERIAIYNHWGNMLTVTVTVTVV